MDMPSIKSVASDLTSIKHLIQWDDCEDGWIDVRLQVREEGGWRLWWGDSSYDWDHRGDWGCGSLSNRTNCRELAKELIDQVRDSVACR